ncbi:F-actin-capping protein subunit alpha [Zea mays]|uniref:F-actin-capping protein subunit alpha n=1 Tax=Zea mays TaxID=4577 RepID=A0A3L6FXL9_MAIZE|nr:F-actin-capping protein subunit alpha [Zea mays]
MPWGRGVRSVDVRALLGDDAVYEAAAAEAFPEYNKARLVSLELPDRSGDIIITAYGEIDKNNYLDPRTAQVATIDHMKQICDANCASDVLFC